MNTIISPLHKTAELPRKHPRVYATVPMKETIGERIQQ